MPAPTPVKRIQENPLAVHERRLLNWLCARLPVWVTPDRLTTLAMVAAVAIFAGYVASNFDPRWLWLSVAGYFVHWFGDSLDGSLARFRHIERPRFGYFIDHSADAFGALFIVGGLGFTPHIRFEVAMVALAGYYLMAIHAFLVARVIGELRLSYAAAGPTELRIVLVVLTVAMYVFGPAKESFLSLGPFDLFVGGTGAVLIVLFGFQTFITARRLIRQGE